MAEVLALSSGIARGHVGLAAITPVLQVLGHEVVALPTVLLSNHPGHTRVARHDLPPSLLTEMVDSYAASGWLRSVAAVLTGYLPSADHVRAAGSIVRRIKAENPATIYLCDPILGDAPSGLYIDPEAAAALRDRLVPLADILTPNAFELAWLSGRPVSRMEDALAAARTLGGSAVLATSVPAEASRIGNVYVEGDQAWSCSVPAIPNIPHGTGDAMSALFLAGCLAGVARPDAFGCAVAAIDCMATRSAGADELLLIETRSEWERCPAYAVERA